MAQSAHCSKIMGDEQIGDAQTPLQITQQVENFGSYQYIECRGRLIENNKVGLGRNRAGDSNSLQLTGTHLMRIQADTGSVKTNQVEQMFPPRLLFTGAHCFGQPDRLQDGIPDPLAGVHAVERILEHHLNT